MNSTTPVPLGVGIDTARYGHHVSFLNEGKQFAAEPFHFTETAEGYRKLQATLASLARQHGNVHFHIRIDAAGQYAENLLQWLPRLDFPTTISVGQPARNRAYRQAHYDKRKADPAESLACARFAIVERPAATPRNPVEFQQLRDAVALQEASAKQQTRLVNQLHGLLARVFPELAVEVPNLSAKWVLKLLEKYPTPAQLAPVPLDALLKIPYLDEPTAKKLQAAAAQSLGSSRGLLAEQLVLQKVAAIRQEQAARAALDKIVEQALRALPEGPHRRLESIPGIGPQTMAALVAKIVSIERFETDVALVGYFGVFPEQVDVSGTDRQGRPKAGSERHMSCKGNDLVRRLLYLAAQCAVKWNPPVKALFQRLKARNKPYNVCLGHCMAKLLRQVFAVWTQDQDFDPEVESKIRVKAPLATAPDPTAETPENEKVVGHKEAVEPPRTVVTTTTSTLTAPATQGKLRPLHFGQLRERITVAMVLERLGWHPQTTRGAQWRGPCPLHESADAASRSLAVHTGKNVYHCHQCGGEGNVLDLWAAIRHLPILEAGWDLVQTFGLEPPLLQTGPSGPEAPPQCPDDPFIGTRNSPAPQSAESPSYPPTTPHAKQKKTNARHHAQRS